jgi:hypothetical protein
MIIHAALHFSVCIDVCSSFEFKYESLEQVWIQFQEVGLMLESPKIPSGPNIS